MSVAIGELLARRAALAADRAAVRTPDRVWTYAEFDGLVDRVAQLLLARGASRGERVAVALRNGVDYLALYYAAARVGAILVGINWRLARPEIAHVLADSAPRIVVSAAEFDATAGAAAREAGIPSLVAGGGYEDALAAVTDERARIAVDPDAPLAICYTSGTTGRAKGAVLTHSQLFWAAQTIFATVDYRARDANLIPTPLFHVGGLSFATLFCAAGASAVVMPAWSPDAVLDAIAARRIDHFFAVPAMLDALLSAERLGTTDLSGLRWIMTGAAPLPIRLIDAYLALGVPLLQSYGATETAGPATCVDVDHVAAKRGSIGKPFFHSEVRVVAADGRDAGAGATGELFVRGRHVFAGYWNDAPATAEALRDGWLASGDVGYRDADGYFHLVDRKKDVIISGGENVYPAEVEAVLAGHPAIAEVAVTGIPDARWGEAVCAVVVPRAGAELALDALREFARDRLAAYKLPARLVLRTAPLPRTANGKLVRSALREGLS